MGNDIATLCFQGLSIMPMVSFPLLSTTIAPLSLLTLAGILPVSSLPISPMLDPGGGRVLLSPEPRSLHLVDQVVEGSDFDEFRAHFWQAVQHRDRAYLLERLPEEGIYIDQAGPIPADWLALEDPESPFWLSLEKMLAPHSCGLVDYPSQSPDAAVWGCPNIDAAIMSADGTAPVPTASPANSLVAVLGERVNVRSRPQLDTEIVGHVSNAVVVFDYPRWRELQQQSPETTGNPIHGWTPVILPDQVKGYVYNRYVYHPQGPKALFEWIDGRWVLVRILLNEMAPPVD